MREVPTVSTDDDREGVIYAALAYVTWGVIPLYWRQLSDVPPFELTVHRVLWCALFLFIVLAARGHLPRLFATFRDRRLIATLALTSVLISVNWTVFIYCVATNQLVEASLGYYINPLISIALGVAFFGEKISRFRMAAIVLAAGAVVVQTIELGHFPWIAPTLAISFGLYGYFRKTTDVSSIDGLCIETWLLFPFTFGLVLWWTLSGTGTFPAPDLTKNALMLGGGPITAIPLTLFAAGARRIRLSTMGFLQYLSPSITLMMAIFWFGEKFTTVDAITFGCVWAALLLVALESQFSRFRAKPEPPQAPAE